VPTLQHALKVYVIISAYVLVGLEDVLEGFSIPSGSFSLEQEGIFLELSKGDRHLIRIYF
jgi:hypothetical protein